MCILSISKSETIVAKFCSQSFWKIDGKLISKINEKHFFIVDVHGKCVVMLLMMFSYLQSY